MSQASFLTLRLQSFVIFDGMVDIVGITGRIIVIKIDPGRLIAKLDHGIIEMLATYVCCTGSLLHFPIQGDS